MLLLSREKPKVFGSLFIQPILNFFSFSLIPTGANPKSVCVCVCIHNYIYFNHIYVHENTNYNIKYVLN